jgi:hypothetical protein
VRLAFATGALAAGLAVAVLATLVVWAITLLTRSSDAWSVAPWLIPVLATLTVVGTYIAEVVVDRAAQRRQRDTGEPWAYRED